MEKVLNEYNEAYLEIDNINQNIEKLKQDEKVLQYIDLSLKKTELERKINKLYQEVKKLNYAKCDHLWVITKMDYDYIEGRKYKYHGCVKCGLNQETQLFHNENSELISLFLNDMKDDYSIMSEYLSEYYVDFSNAIDVVCDLDKAHQMYLKILEANPDIDENTLIDILSSKLNDLKKGYSKSVKI